LGDLLNKTRGAPHKKNGRLLRCPRGGGIIYWAIKRNVRGGNGPQVLWGGRRSSANYDVTNWEKEHEKDRDNGSGA